ncbi:MAG: SEL1-like repeat protein, partial [Victivallales bacterium]|nr:SEL1-like repeat protein [Victivallales bacterium]
MKKCPNGHEMPDEMLFCTMCGYKFPQTKECPQCHAEVNITFNFCGKCGYNFTAKDNAENGKGVSLGEKSVVAGSVVAGNQDNRKFFAPVTINEDQTKQLVKCHVCNKPLPIIDAFICSECKQYTCDAHLDKETGLCHSCIQRHEEQYRSHLNALLDKDGAVSYAARRDLERLQKELKISGGRRDAIEREAKERHLSKAIPRNEGEMSPFDRMAYDKAVISFYEEGNVEEAAEVLTDVKFGPVPNEQLLSLKLSVLAWHDEEAFRRLAGEIHADLEAVSLAKIDMSLCGKRLREAEDELMRAEAMWPSSLLVKCRKVVFWIEMCKFSGDRKYLARARELASSLEPQTKLEASWCARVNDLLGKAFGEETPSLTREYCREHNLFYAIANIKVVETFLIRKRAERGDAEAQFRLGECFKEGNVVEENLKEAVKWYRKAAYQGNAEAKFRLGECYEKGNGVEVNLKEAVKWYEMASAQENADANKWLVEVLLRLGECYEKGDGVEKNLETSVMWYGKAADLGNAVAKSRLAEVSLRLGECYEKGNGVEKNLEEAEKWYGKAAGQGNAVAKSRLAEVSLRLGECYE